MNLWPSRSTRCFECGGVGTTDLHEGVETMIRLWDGCEIYVTSGQTFDPLSTGADIRDCPYCRFALYWRVA